MNKEIILDNLTMKDVLERYGIRADRERIPCPIHSGKNNNFQIYEKSFFCFKCGAGGDVIQFVRLLFRTDYKTAVRKIEYDFGLSCGGSLKERHRLKKLALERKEQKQKEAEKKRMCAACFNQLCGYLAWLREQPETAAVRFDLDFVGRRLDRMNGDFEPFDASALIAALYTKHNREGGADQ